MIERLVSALRRRTPLPEEGAVIGGPPMAPCAKAGEQQLALDVSEFVRVSEQSVGDPAALAREFDRDFEKSLADHQLTREQLETPLTV